MRFAKLARYQDLDSELTVPLSLAFRRFYFDGLAVGKFEIGIFTRNHQPISLNARQVEHFIRHCLKLPVTIPAVSDKALVTDLSNEPVGTTLSKVGRPLAKFYAAATISHPPPVKLEDWWVVAGTPLLCLILDTPEKVNFSFRGKSLPRTQTGGFGLSYFEVPNEDRNLRMWVIRLGRDKCYKAARALKICLLRLHAEHESLRVVLQNVATNKIEIIPRSNESNTLQRYLHEALKRISRLGSEADHLSKTDLAELARESEDMVSPGHRESLLATLQNISVRKNIFYNVQDYVNTEIHVKEMYMEAKYKITGGSQGAVGDNPQASNNNFNTWNQAGGDLKTLADGLAQLRTELGKRAQTSEQFESASAIAKAENAAKEGDGPTVFAHLKAAGTWALETATSIGIPVAIHAIKAAIGG